MPSPPSSSSLSVASFHMSWRRLNVKMNGMDDDFLLQCMWYYIFYQYNIIRWFLLKTRAHAHEPHSNSNITATHSHYRYYSYYYPTIRMHHIYICIFEFIRKCIYWRDGHNFRATKKKINSMFYNMIIINLDASTNNEKGKSARAPAQKKTTKNLAPGTFRRAYSNVHIIMITLPSFLLGAGRNSSQFVLAAAALMCLWLRWCLKCNSFAIASA